MASSHLFPFQKENKILSSDLEHTLRFTFFFPWNGMCLLSHYKYNGNFDNGSDAYFSFCSSN